MNPLQQAAFADALGAAQRLMAQRDFAAAQAHLERAHILGQREVWPHVLVHWLMLRVALARRQWGAVAGQGVRIVLGAAGSAVGVVPTGNPGGSDIGMFTRVPVAPALQRLIDGKESGSAPAPWPPGEENP